jgi:hypothetical protein
MSFGIRLSTTQHSSGDPDNSSKESLSACSLPILYLSKKIYYIIDTQQRDISKDGGFGHGPVSITFGSQAGATEPQVESTGSATSATALNTHANPIS